MPRVARAFAANRSWGTRLRGRRGAPLTSREDRKTAASAPARRVSSGSAPRRPLLLLPRSEGHLWDFDFYDASEGLERAIANPTDQLVTIISLDLTINLFVILTQKV